MKKDILINYKKCWNYLKESKKFIYAILIIFTIAILIGMFVPTPIEIQEAILKFIEELIEKTKDMSASELIGFIFLNNLQSSFLGMIMGTLFGIFSIITTIANGYLLGFVFSMSIQANGFLSLWRILPHGIFELPAVFISLALGLKLGSFIFRENKKKFLKESLINSIRVFFLIVIPLLVIAAIIEGILIFLSK